MNLMATRRSSDSSCARSTTPMEPLPGGAITRYTPPTSVPGSMRSKSSVPASDASAGRVCRRERSDTVTLRASTSWAALAVGRGGAYKTLEVDSMRWDPSHESEDVVDRRGESGPSRAGGGLGGLLFLVPWLMRSRIGRVVLVVGALFFVGRALLGGVTGSRLNSGTSGAAAPAETPETHFVAFVLDDVQKSWTDAFAQQPTPYRHAKLVLYTDSTQT